MKKEMEEIIRENYGDIYKYCFRHLNRKGEAEDMTGNTGKSKIICTSSPATR